MKVLVLSPYPGGLGAALKDERVIYLYDSMVKPEDWPEVDWVISYGYPYIIKEPHLSKYKNRIVNLHVGLLPWNRGASPNFWSWFDSTPKGVTIHYVDAGLDTGDIIAQEQVLFPPNVTLATSYMHLRETIETLFAKMWPRIKDGNYIGLKQSPGGSGHISYEINQFYHALPNGWDTPVWIVDSLGRAVREANGQTTHPSTGRVH
jgi:hypothetical protein